MTFDLSLANLCFSGLIWRNDSLWPGIVHVDEGRIREGRRGKIIEVPYILPPFTDLHLHGGWGVSFQDGNFSILESKLKKIGVFLAIPTLSTDDLFHVRQVALSFREYVSQQKASIFPFLRMEGPFISEGKKGAQEKKFIQRVGRKNIDSFFSIPEIKMFTFAPEIEGSLELVKRALAMGKIPSVGHSQGTLSDFDRVYQLGVRHITHYPNALSPLHHRELGMVGAGLVYDDLHLEVIGDGIHTSFEFLELLIKFKGPTFALVSDLIPPAYASQGVNFGQKFDIQGKKIMSPDGILMGGGTSVPEQVVQLRKKGWPVEALIKLASENARLFLNFPPGNLEEGQEANFLICGENLEVLGVFEKGKCLFCEGALSQEF